MNVPSSGAPPWWDREFDPSGKPIRADIRASATQIWERACRQTIALLGEVCEAYGLMERAVIQVSRYLDRRATPLFGQDTDQLLMCAFCRGLRRSAARRRRTVLADDADLDAMSVARSSPIDPDRRLDADKARSHFSERARKMHDFRKAGYAWKEIAPIFGTTEDAARAEFSRELEKARQKMRKPLSSDKRPSGADLTSEGTADPG